MIYVVGSGPAGVSCAAALLKCGAKVTILDVGIELESEKKLTLEKMQNQNHQDWNKDSIQMLKSGMSARSSGIPLKYVYGSNFPYRDADVHLNAQLESVDTGASFARGGLSNVWGASILPYHDDEIQDWPVKVRDLAAHYQSVLSLMQLVAVRDDLDKDFPLYTERFQVLNASRQAQAFLKDLDLHKNEIRGEGFMYGRARLALRDVAHHEGIGAHCVYCGLCMYGCPYDVIYNSAQTLENLQRDKNFSYQPGVMVERFLEKGDSVRIEALSHRDKKPMILDGEKLYLACGVLPTAKILLESMKAYDRSVELRDSQYFLLPLLRYQNVPGVLNEELYTLAQIFMEIQDPEISAKRMHLQIYTYNDLMQSGIRRAVGPLYPLFSRLNEKLLGRLLIIQGYLHSHDSSRISIRLTRHGEEKKILVKGLINHQAREKIHRLIKKLYGMRKYFKAIPLTPFLNLGKPGRGFHSGGTFPMREHPSTFETDSLGRPSGARNVHVVDATVFPSIPAGTITLSVMANAHRIATESL